MLQNYPFSDCKTYPNIIHAFTPDKSISYLKEFADNCVEKPIEDLSGDDINDHIGKLAIVRNIIDGISMYLKELMEKKT